MKFLQFSARSFGNEARLSAAMLRVSRLSTTPAGQASQDDLLPRTLRCHNGQKVPGTFSAQEMQRRVAMVREHMAAEDIEACVFTSIHNVNYFSDFLYCSFGRPFALVITPDKAVTVSPGIDYGQPWRRTVGDDNITYTDWRKDNYHYAVQQLVSRNAHVDASPPA